MADDTEPANDYQDSAIANASAREKLDKVVLSIARLIGRQIAREHFREFLQTDGNRASPRHKGSSEEGGGVEGG